METEHVFGDMSEAFEFDDPSVDYLDGPLSGWIRRKADAQWFAFDCQPVVYQLVWHWTLVPTSERTNVRQVLEDAAKRKDGDWLSVVEDRRTGIASTCRLVRIANDRARPIVSSVRTREYP
jgi:hypothetical protein